MRAPCRRWLDRAAGDARGPCSGQPFGCLTHRFCSRSTAGSPRRGLRSWEACVCDASGRGAAGGYAQHAAVRDVTGQPAGTSKGVAGLICQATTRSVATERPYGRTLSLARARKENYANQVVGQRVFKFRTWGGRRRGAGRPRKDGKKGPGVPHVGRAALPARFPVHVTWRMEPGVWNLRTRRCFSVLKSAMYAGASRGGFRLVHYVVMGNHVHLLVEAADRVRLARGMQGLGVRIARALNRVMRRRGRVLGDRYHAHILRTPSEVRRARVYLSSNAQRHYAHAAAVDRYASVAPVMAPRTWLLARATT